VPNQTYYYRLKAVATTTSSAFSAPVSTKTPPLPSAPTVTTTPTPADNFQYAELTDGKLTLKWLGATNTVTYIVKLGTSPTTLTTRTELPYTASPTYEVSGLLENTTYYWRVDAVNAQGTAEGTVWSFRTTRAIPPQLVGHWGFDETEGTQIRDQSAYANTGVLGLDDDDPSIRIPGKVNNALDFSTARSDMYVVSIPNQDQLYLDQQSFSISFWMKASEAQLPQDNNTSAYMLCKGSITRNATTGATGKRFNIELKNKQVRFAIDDDKNKDELQATGAPFFTNDWVHVVALRDVPNKKLQLYMNSVFVKEISTKALGIGETSALIVGNIGELEFLAPTNQPAAYKGALDELKVFNYVLSPAQIAQLAANLPLASRAAQPSLNHLEAFPNPFAGQATLHFQAAETGHAQLQVYNAMGQHVTTLHDGPVQAGRDYNFTVDGTNLAKGVYLGRLTTNGAVETKRLLLLK